MHDRDCYHLLSKGTISLKDAMIQTVLQALSLEIRNVASKNPWLIAFFANLSGNWQCPTPPVAINNSLSEAEYRNGFHCSRIWTKGQVSTKRSCSGIHSVRLFCYLIEWSQDFVSPFKIIQEFMAMSQNVSVLFLRTNANRCGGATVPSPKPLPVISSKDQSFSLLLYHLSGIFGRINWGNIRWNAKIL